MDHTGMAQRDQGQCGGSIPRRHGAWGSLPSLPGSIWAAFGLWRSLVAHLTGGQGVAGSNPVSPTEKPPLTSENAGQRRFVI